MYRPREIKDLKAEVLSALLLDLYRYARELPLADFQRRTLERLCEDLPFDSAWWGLTHRDRELHSSFPFRLPESYGDAWERMREHDDLATVVLAQPGRTVIFDNRAMSRSLGLRELSREYGVRQTLCTLLDSPILNLATFLSLYRHRSMPRFTEAERAFKQMLMPHLWATWTTNWIAQLAAARQHVYSDRVALAVVDRKGVLHAAEPRFADLLRTEWPDWQGPELPAAVGRGGRTPVTFDGARTVLRLLPVSGLMLAEIRERSALEKLTPRELVIAESFGHGKSYKEIAAALPVSPATVRAHLRAIYSKLGISDKTELTQLLNSRESAHSPLAPP